MVFVADTGHHQVVACTPGGDEVARAGSGRPGLLDGPASEARLHHPHGLAVGDGLYVADTSSHAVRAIEVGSGAISTVHPPQGQGARGWRCRGGTDLARPGTSPWHQARP